MHAVLMAYTARIANTSKSATNEGTNSLTTEYALEKTLIVAKDTAATT